MYVGPKLAKPSAPVIYTVTLISSGNNSVIQYVAEGDLINLEAEGLSWQTISTGENQGAIGTYGSNETPFYPWTIINDDITIDKRITINLNTSQQ
jgi:hypothetical protein